MDFVLFSNKSGKVFLHSIFEVTYLAALIYRRVTKNYFYVYF